jgi:TonB family protein
MCSIHKLKYLLTLLLGLFFIANARAEPMLNGMGIHKELSQEVFIGGLYSDTLSDNSDVLLNTDLPMRMELKIVAPDGMTTRRFSRLWIEGMAINQKADVLTAQADNMVKFDGLFKGRFQTNDHIVFDSTPGSGVNISVNGVILGNIDDNKFFSMLLSTWIGRVPLASDYRDSMLKMGSVNGGLRGRYETITPSASRVAEINKWTSGAVIAAKPATGKVEPSKVEPSKPKLDDDEKLGLAGKPEIPTLAATHIEKPKLDVPPIIERPEPSQTSAATTPVKVAAVTPKPAPKVIEEDEEEEGPALTAQSLLARQFYVSDILKKVFGKTRYPTRALERGQEGSVRVAVVVDRKGNILSTSVLEESRYDLLNKEAKEAINRAAPFPEMPAALPGSRFEFTVPIRFTLPKR